jgi:hypothetical protein
MWVGNIIHSPFLIISQKMKRSGIKRKMCIYTLVLCPAQTFHPSIHPSSIHQKARVSLTSLNRIMTFVIRDKRKEEKILVISSSGTFASPPPYVFYVPLLLPSAFPRTLTCIAYQSINIRSARGSPSGRQSRCRSGMRRLPRRREDCFASVA